MRTAVLVRRTTDDEGTFGVITTDSGFSCFVGELPWRDNAPNASCIPQGTYTVTWRFSPTKGNCYHVENVPGRTNVEIHSANFCGDVTKRFHADLLGCLAPGLKVGILGGQTAVLQSREALKALEVDLNQEEWSLTIQGVCG